MMKNILVIIALYYFCVSGSLVGQVGEFPLKEVSCPSSTIRSIEDFNKLHECTVVNGYVRIVLANFSNPTSEKLIPSKVEEITEYLLVYRAVGVQTLEHLFPKLTIIRGTNLLYDQYGLVILQNREMKNIGLLSLLRVLQGSIRIEFNPALCFTDTINWVWILGNSTKQYSYIVRNNKPSIHCPQCYSDHEDDTTKEKNRHGKCWSQGKFQLISLDYYGGKPCHKHGNDEIDCLTACTNIFCRHCKHFVADTGCVKTCLPPMFKLAFKRRCVANCTKMGLVQVGIQCMPKCPKYYKLRKDINVCVLSCEGNFVVHNAEDLQGLADCTRIDGSLTIELYDANEAIVQDLEMTFFDLNEIRDYLKIVNSPQITSLNFFKSLHTIRGYTLIEKKYALYIVDNNYLEDLFPGNVVVMHGCVYFHLNPLLCYEKIESLQKHFKECRELSIKDVSIHSNGERAVCGEFVTVLNSTVVDVNSTSASIELDIMSESDRYLLLGYVYYYKEAPTKNVTMFDGRHGCGKDDWFTDIVKTQRRRHILTHLKPATRYAFFVNSLTIVDYDFQAEHVSEIGYFETLPDRPDVVAKLYYHTLSTKEIELHWWPPVITNGIIEKYILQYEETTNTTMPHSNGITENMAGDCECARDHTDSHIPTPHAEKFFNIEEMVYKDILMNFIFVRKRPSNHSVKVRNVRDLKHLTKPEYTEMLRRHVKRSARSFTQEDLDAVLRRFEIENINIQEEGKEDYIIQHPLPVCYATNALIENQTQTKCAPLEIYNDAIEVPGSTHSFILKNLEPAKTYRISVRACVKDLANGCGAEKAVFAETMSQRVETMMGNITFYEL